MPVKPLLPGRHLLPAFSLMIGLMPVPAAAFLHASETDTDSGRALYVEHCAAYHGVDLEEQPDWRSPDANGFYPAPPHDETGHTWHHDDAVLIDYIARGGQAVFFATLRGINHAIDRHREGVDKAEAVEEGIGVAVTGTMKATVDLAEMGYKGETRESW